MIERRKTRRSDDEFEMKTTTTISEAFDEIVEASEVVKKNADYLKKAVKPIIFIVGVIGIISVILVIVFSARDERIERLEKSIKILNTESVFIKKSADAARIASKDAEMASNRAQIASETAKKALEESITQVRRGGVSPEVVTALERINEIYTICVLKKEC